MGILKGSDDLAVMVLAAVKAGWTPPAVFDLTRTAQAIVASAGTDFEMKLLMAAMVRSADDGQCPDALIGSAIHSLSQPFARRNRTLGSLPEDVLPYQVAAIIDAKLAQVAREDEATRSGLADKALTSMVRQLAAAYPELGLTFGYIGNCDLYGGERWDDRSWGVSTRFTDGETRMTVRFGGVPTFLMGRLMVMAERDLKGWCDRQMERFAKGHIRRVG